MMIKLSRRPRPLVPRARSQLKFTAKQLDKLSKKCEKEEQCIFDEAADECRTGETSSEPTERPTAASECYVDEASLS